MDQLGLWQEGLERLRLTAAANHYHVTVGDIVRCFDGIELTRENVAWIYQYAEEKNIVIDDYQLHDTRKVIVTREDVEDASFADKIVVDDSEEEVLEVGIDHKADESVADKNTADKNTAGKNADDKNTAGKNTDGKNTDDKNTADKNIAGKKVAVRSGPSRRSNASRRPKAVNDLSGEEKAYFREFLRDLEMIEKEEDGETGWLLERLLSGDDSVMHRLIEINLHMVLDIARRSVGKGVPLGDLVQEGNLALVNTIDDYRLTGQTVIDDEFRLILYRKVEEAIDNAVGEEKYFSETAEKLARDANRLLTATRELEEKLGRAATLAELAAELGEPEEYIKEVMRISQAVMDNAAARRDL